MHLSVRVMLRHVVLIRQSAAAKALKQPVQAPAHSVREVQGGKTAIYIYIYFFFYSLSLCIYFRFYGCACFYLYLGVHIYTGVISICRRAFALLALPHYQGPPGEHEYCLHVF